MFGLGANDVISFVLVQIIERVPGPDVSKFVQVCPCGFVLLKVPRNIFQPSGLSVSGRCSLLFFKERLFVGSGMLVVGQNGL